MDKGTVHIVLVFPQPWPPVKEKFVFRRKENNSLITLVSDKKGRFCFRLHSDDDKKEYLFQPIVLKGSGRAVLTISWSPQEVKLFLGKQKLLLEKEANGEAFVYETNNVPYPPLELIIGGINTSIVKTEAEYIFLETLIDIDKKVIKGDRYSLIKAAGLLRQLLLDSLKDRANENHRLKFEFVTTDYSSQLSLSPNAQAKDLDGLLFPKAKRITNDLESFLKAPCFMMGDVTATVKDTIRACANAKGGIHLGKTRNAEEGLVINWDKMFQSVGLEPSLKAIASICRISLRGLKPLAEAIKKDGINWT